MSILSGTRRVLAFVILSTIICFSVTAAPQWGDRYDFRQPDGSLVPVMVWGDEYYQRVESPDGFTLIRDADGWICYAQLSPDKSEFLATPLHYTGTSNIARLLTQQISKGIRLDGRARQAKAFAMLQKREVDLTGMNLIRFGEPAKKGRQVVNTVKGLTLLIDFSDVPATISRQQIDDFFNKTGYTEFQNKGSIHDYFWDVSGNKLNYTNTVTEYYRAKQPITYYDTPTGKVQELILEALRALDARGFNFSQLSTSNGQVLAVNVLHAGRTSQGWSLGLWPHSGSISGFSADGVSVRRYQLTGIGTSLTIGTTCHENGHMVCRYPDLYDYDSDSRGVGKFCLMCTSSGTNPVPPCAPLRAYYTKWDTVTDISNASLGSLFNHVANSNTSFIYKNPSNSNEAFYIEARRKVGRSTNISDSGLAIWHWDYTGSNDNQAMTTSSHYKVTLEQADGRWDFERNVNSGDNTDLFDKNYKSTFDDGTSPSAKWWNGANSGLQIANISEAGPTMSFTLGAFALALSVPKTGDVFYVDDTVKLTWNVFDKTIQNVKLQLSTDNGVTFTPITTSVSNNGTYTWIITDAESNACIIKLSDTDDAPTVSSGIFSIKREAIIDVSPQIFTVNTTQGTMASEKLVIGNQGKGSLNFTVSTSNTPSNILINELYVSKTAFFDGFELWNRGNDQDMSRWKVLWNDNTQTSSEFLFEFGFIFEAGKTIVLTDDAEGTNDSTFYMGLNVAWSREDSTEFSAAILDDQNKCIDFIRTSGNSDPAPDGTEWNGNGIPLSNDYVFRTGNTDNNNATDWSSGNSGTVNRLNNGQTSSSDISHWVKITPEAAKIDSIGDLDLALLFDATKLNAGTYYDTILIFHNSRGIPSPRQIVCILNVNATGTNVANPETQKTIRCINNTFFIQNLKKSVVTITVFDMHGRVLLEQIHRDSETHIRFTAPSQWASGTYFCSIKIGKQVTRQVLVIHK